jgi:molybdopterin synthase catalytic subunit
VGVFVVEVTDQPINSTKIKEQVWAPDCGALVEFHGLVRNHDSGRDVLRLDYEGHETALAVVQKICEEIAHKYPKVRFGTSHRIGQLAIGDLAFYVVTASAHRGAAFEVNQLLVEQVKERIPVWKNQIFIDGSNEWVNSA